MVGRTWPGISEEWRAETEIDKDTKCVGKLSNDWAASQGSSDNRMKTLLLHQA